MSLKMHYKNSLYKDILTYLIVIFLLLDSGSMYITIVGSPITNALIKIFLGFTCVFCICIKFKVPWKGAMLAIVIFFLLLIYTLATRYNIDKCLIYSSVFFILILYYSCKVRDGEIYQFLNIYSKTVVILAVISIFFWLFGSTLHLISPKPIEYIWGRDYAYRGYSYFFLYFENPVQAEGGIIRNTGIYTEAPGYSSRLAFALCIELFINNEKKKNARIIILMLAMITTLSSKSFILLVYFIGVVWVFYTKNRNYFQRAIHIAITLIICVGAFFLLYMIMQEEMATMSSARTRVDHLQSGIKTWLQHPFLGVGYSNTKAIAENHMYKSTPEGASMGITTFLAEGGLYLFLFYIGSAFVVYRYVIRINKRRRKDYFFCLGAIMFNWFISDAAYSTLMISMVCIGYSLLVGNKNEKKCNNTGIYKVLLT